MAMGHPLTRFDDTQMLDERHDSPPDFTDPESCWVDTFMELCDLLPEWDTQKVMRHLERLNDLEAVLP